MRREHRAYVSDHTRLSMDEITKIASDAAPKPSMPRSSTRRRARLPGRSFCKTRAMSRSPTSWRTCTNRADSVELCRRRELPEHQQDLRRSAEPAQSQHRRIPAERLHPSATLHREPALRIALPDKLKLVGHAAATVGWVAQTTCCLGPVGTRGISGRSCGQRVAAKSLLLLRNTDNKLSVPPENQVEQCGRSVLPSSRVVRARAARPRRPETLPAGRTRLAPPRSRHMSLMLDGRRMSVPATLPKSRAVVGCAIRRSRSSGSKSSIVSLTTRMARNRTLSCRHTSPTAHDSMSTASAWCISPSERFSAGSRMILSTVSSRPT